MGERQRLSSTPRDVLGKKVKQLRRAGLIPGNVIEAGRQSRSIQVPERALADLVQLGVTGQLIDLEQGGATEPVLMDTVDVDVLTSRLVHATFRKVDLSKPVHVMVQVSLTGRAPASDVAELVVLQNLLEIEISALPAEIPSGLQADVSDLIDVGDEVLVRDLQAVDGSYEPLVDVEISVAQVSVARQVEEEPEEELEEVLLGEVVEEGEPGAEDSGVGAKSSDGDSVNEDGTS